MTYLSYLETRRLLCSFIVLHYLLFSVNVETIFKYHAVKFYYTLDKRRSFALHFKFFIYQKITQLQ